MCILKTIIRKIYKIYQQVVAEEQEYNEFKAYMSKNPNATTTMIQQHFNIGYNHTCKLLDRFNKEKKIN